MDIPSGLTAKERIIKETLEIIKTEGYQAVTIRKIADKAGVNIAAINYYYGSKDSVINEALKEFTSQIISCFEFLKTTDEPKTKLRTFLLNYTSLINQYPDIIKIFIKNAINDHESENYYTQFMKETGFPILKNNLKELHPEAADLDLSMKVFQIIGSLFFPFLLKPKLKEISPFDFDFLEHREKYITFILSQIEAPL